MRVIERIEVIVYIVYTFIKYITRYYTFIFLWPIALTWLSDSFNIGAQVRPKGSQD